MKYMKQPNEIEGHSAEQNHHQSSPNNQDDYQQEDASASYNASLNANHINPQIGSLINGNGANSSIIFNPNICSNKICKLYVKTTTNLTNENNPMNLCRECLIQYQKQFFCLYCKQIYFDTTDDGKQWIQCDQCQRWVHTQCADFYPVSSNTIFNCIKCKKVDAVVTGGRRASGGRGTGGKTGERKKPQECMLNAFGFYWQLGGAQLAEDIQKLKMYLK